MPKFPILVASYTDEIVTLEFDSDKATLTPTSKVAAGHHPSWIAGHPTDASLIVTGLEQPDGKVVALKYDASGKGTVLSESPTFGQDPCHVNVDKDEVFASNYTSGSISVTPISLSKSSPFSSPGYSIQLVGNGPNKSRQEQAHAHQAVIHPKYQELLVPDLGADIVRRYKKSPEGQWTFQGHVGFESGGGPRHIAFYEDDLFTLLELSNKVARHHLPPLPSPPKHLVTKPTMSNPPQPSDMIAAEILIPPTNATFLTPYLYASNRDDPSPEGDSISIFSIEEPGSLELIQEVRTGLKHVRGIVFGGQDDRYLAVGGVKGGGVKVYERVDGGKDLKELVHKADVEAPTGFWWLKA